MKRSWGQGAWPGHGCAVNTSCVAVRWADGVGAGWDRRRVACGSWAVVALAVVGVLAAGAFGQAPFTEEAQARGISFVTAQALGDGAGVAFADLDGDGDADVVLVGNADGVVGVYENDGAGYFVDHSGSSGIGPAVDTMGVVAGDYDRDGDLDLYISRRLQPNLLLRNEGGFVFTDVSAAAGVADAGWSSGCAWGDFDNDGWLDLYVANMGSVTNPDDPDRLFHNLGDGTFDEVSVSVGVDLGDELTYQAVFFDYDHDGDADVYLANDKGLDCAYGRQNHLFENVGGLFVDVTKPSGTEACVNAMCIAVGDFDGNTHQDLYVTNTPEGNALMLNQGGGVFERFEHQAGVSSYAVGWGSVFLDYDNDGHLDLYVCNMNAPNRLYRHDGTFPCADMSSVLGVDVGGLSYAVATADIDADGDLDLLVQNHDEPMRLFINHEDGERRWIKFDVVGEGPARFAVGAIVDVRTGDVWRTREVIAGSNYKSQNDIVQHFGLGDAAIVDAVEVMWPGGATRTLSQLPADHTWRVYPVDKLGDADHDGDRDAGDFAVLAGCMAGVAVGSLEPGCEVMDFDGGCQVDLVDFAAFQNGFTGE
ncbi:MAG: CRTAC1 family protein [Phycisphaerae bacterium]